MLKGATAKCKYPNLVFLFLGFRAFFNPIFFLSFQISFKGQQENFADLLI